MTRFLKGDLWIGLALPGLVPASVSSSGGGDAIRLHVADSVLAFTLPWLSACFGLPSRLGSLAEWCRI
jgi:hypothetical protein